MTIIAILIIGLTLFMIFKLLKGASGIIKVLGVIVGVICLLFEFVVVYRGINNNIHRKVDPDGMYIDVYNDLLYVIHRGLSGNYIVKSMDDSILCPLTIEEIKQLGDPYCNAFSGDIYKPINTGGTMVTVTQLQGRNGGPGAKVSKMEYILVDVDGNYNINYRRIESFPPLFLATYIDTKEIVIEKDGIQVSITDRDLLDQVSEAYLSVFGTTYLCEVWDDYDAMYKVSFTDTYPYEFYISDDGYLYGYRLSSSFEDVIMPEVYPGQSPEKWDWHMIFIPDSQSKTNEFVGLVIDMYNEGLADG